MVVLAALTGLPMQVVAASQKDLVAVFVLDTGIKSSFVEGPVRGDEETRVDHGSIVAKVLRQSTPSAEVISIAVVNPVSGQVDIGRYYKALGTVLDFMKANPDRRVVVNMSFGGKFYTERRRS